MFGMGAGLSDEDRLDRAETGKVLRRSIQAIAEGRDPGDLTTLDDQAGIEQIKGAVAPK